MAQLTSFLSRSYSTAMLAAGLVISLAACTPPTPPPSPTPRPAGSPTSIPATATLPPTATPTPRPTPTPEPSPSPTPPKTTIVIWESLSQAQAERLIEDIQAFQQEFPQFTVVRQHYDNPEQFMTPLMAGDIKFDMILASPVLLGSLQATRQIALISDFFPPSFIDAFESVTLQGAAKKGQLWGVPDTAGFHLLLFYNRDLIDTPPANTDELWETAQASQGADGTARRSVGINSYDPLWLVPWLAAYGGWLTDDAGQPTLNTPAMESAIDQQLSWLGRSPNQESAGQAIAPLTTYEEARAQFLAGDIAMMIDGEWALTELAQADTIDWGVAPLPALSLDEENQPAVPLILARYWGISRSAAGNQALAATALVEYMTRPERQLEWMVQFGQLPTRRQALDDPLIGNNPAMRVSAEQLRAGRMIPLGTNANMLLNAMREPLRQAIDGELTPAEAAALMQQSMSTE